MKFNIKRARERAGLSQTELARIIGVAPSTFNGYESGLHDPKSNLLVKIAQACDTTVDFLLERTDSPFPVSTEDKDSQSLSMEEKELVFAWRAADERWKEVAMDALVKHPAKKEKESSA